MPVKRRSDKVDLRFIEERVETPKAYLLVMSTGEEVWLPKSQIEVDWDKGVVRVPRWLAEEKELLPPSDSGPEDPPPPTHRLQ